MNDLDSVLNGIKELGSLGDTSKYYRAHTGYEKSIHELGWQGVAWNGYRIPLGVKILDGGFKQCQSENHFEKDTSQTAEKKRAYREQVRLEKLSGTKAIVRRPKSPALQAENEAFLDIVRKLKHERKLTYNDLAELCRTHVTHMARVLKNGIHITQETKAKMAKGLGI